MDEDYAKENIARNLDESYRNQLRMMKTTFTDAVIIRYFKSIKDLEKHEDDHQERIDCLLSRIS